MAARRSRTLAVVLGVGSLLSGCARETVCTLIGGSSEVSLTTPGDIVRFCIDEIGCADDVSGHSAIVGVPDDGRLTYRYNVIVEIDGSRVDFDGEVELEPLFPNGEECGRSGKVGELVVIDADTIEVR